ncbi:hypothetical protein ABK040_010307 [Willaertia magna]
MSQNNVSTTHGGVSEKAEVSLPPKRDNNKSALIQTSPLVSFASGAVYGITSVIVGQPLDMIKTTMQSTTQINVTNNSTMSVIRNIYKNHGFLGFYRGSVPLLVSSSVLRSLQFGGYSLALDFIVTNHLISKVDFRKENLNVLEVKPYSFHPEMFLAGCFGGACRAIAETPVEYLKVRRQTYQSWKLNEMFRGFSATLLRNMFLLGTFFIFVDFFTQEYRNYQVRKELEKYEDKKAAENKPFEFKKLNPFFVGSACSTLAWLLVFPFDVIKSQIQSMKVTEQLGVVQRLTIVGKTLGFRGFFRGVVPASARSIVANGLSMIVFDYVSKNFSHWEHQLRGK